MLTSTRVMPGMRGASPVAGGVPAVGPSTEGRLLALAHESGVGSVPSGEQVSFPRPETAPDRAANLLAGVLGQPDERLGHPRRHHNPVDEAQLLGPGRSW